MQQRPRSISRFLKPGRWLSAAACVAVLLLASCGTPPPPPAVLTLNITGAADQNPDEAGQAAPVAVQVYQLDATGKFLATDVYSLMGAEAATLGSEEATGSERFLVTPGQSESVVRALKPGVQFIGVAVLFRDINHAQWRAVAPVAASGPSTLILQIKGETASLMPGKTP
jgi:type VI secretion system protein VasD